MVSVALQAVGLVFSGMTAYNTAEANAIAKEKQHQHTMEFQAQSAESAFDELNNAVKASQNKQTKSNEDTHEFQ